MFFQRLGQFAHADGMLGREPDRIAKAQAVDIFERSTAFAFVGGEDHGLARTAQGLGDDLVAGSDAIARVDDEEQGIGLGDGGDGLLGHALGQRTGRGLFETGGVDQAEGEAVKLHIHCLPVAGDARRVMHDGGMASRQPVDQPRLADIGASDDGEGEHGRPLTQRDDFRVAGVDVERAVGHHRRHVAAGGQVHAGQEPAVIG